MAEDVPSAPAHPQAEEPAPSVDGFIGYNLKRVYMIFQADMRAAMGDDGLSPRVYAALSLVVHQPDITQSEVARRLGIERSGLVAIVDQLQDRGHVQRIAVHGDRRVQALRPTAGGIAVLEEATVALQRHEEALLEPLSPAERAHLLGLLQRVRGAWEAQT